ncbi:hypothetical protein [Lacihabitans sp. CS3-21]|uniref:hypothetical protein n=1 Tax=Lacihabitans sp. CS3-21 TaxID=2487332 RepID=UPI0020CC166B|nr:hypothetical protein [Lacihabitans sp. CS3-21]MCP9745130.1 hypothetical protein [Lacihabitans sp. CS3-21]
MKHLSMILFLTGLFFSCKNSIQEDLTPVESLNSNKILIPSTAKLYDGKGAKLSYLEGNFQYEQFAKSLAKILKDKEVRQIIKSEANKKFDGDFDILAKTFLSINLSNDSFKNIYNRNKEGETIESLISGNEKLNISIPLNIEKWNEISKEVLVVVANGAIENETKQLKAFDSKGKTYLIDAKIQPDQPVIVIGNNERIGLDVNKLDKKGAKVAYARNLGNAEIINYIQCPNLSDIESWYFGGPELRFNVVVYNVSYSTAFSPNPLWSTPSRNQASGGYSAYLNLFNWYFNTSHGQNYVVNPFEIDDAGSTQSLTVGVNGTSTQGITASYNITYKAQDKVLAGRLINYLDSAPTTVGDDRIFYKLENQ